MTAILMRLWTKLSSRQAPISLMIVGLDDAGKTSTLDIILKSAPKSSKDGPRKQPTKSASDRKRVDNSQTARSDISHSHGSNNGPTLNATNDCGSSKKVDPTVGYNFERIRYRGQTVNLLDFSGQSRYRGLWQEFYDCVDGIVFVIDSSDLIRFVVARDELETLLGHPYFASIAPTITSFALPEEHVSSMNPSIPVIQQAPPHSVPQLCAQQQLTISQGKLIKSPLNEMDVQASSSSRTTADLPTNCSAGVRLRARVPILFLANKSDLNNSADSETIVEALNLKQVPKQRHPWLIQATSVLTESHSIIDGLDWLLDVIFSGDCT